MATTKEFPSGGTGNGRPIKIAATATAGTLFHTAHATSKDEVFMFVSNTDVVAREITVEFGGTTSPDDHIKALVPAKETVLVVAGIPLSNSLVVRAFAAVANLLTMHGYVNRIS
jgi:hypothetical protein